MWENIKVEKPPVLPRENIVCNLLGGAALHSKNEPPHEKGWALIPSLPEFKKHLDNALGHMV